ncbi:MAG: glycosyltransferase family 2 protein [Myroides sp.]|nr:glycosyltransferase family 2 protein [uncultured Flavobacterium sp.]MBS7319972.1 glycosyltransferase family 2 protein [Myroides sp.]
MKIALLISTYNWPEALELIFKSINEQTVLPDEVLIADDGSTEETKKLIDDFTQKSTFKVIHVWHEDQGFRKAIVLNKAVAQSSCEYIIQIDGDCIMHPDFIADHKKNAKKGLYLYGTRATITKNALPRIFNQKQTKFHFFSKDLKKRTRTIHSNLLSELYKPHQYFSDNFRGCNVSFWRSDFIKINGYNEVFEGWGREDSDLVIRMGNMGIWAKRLRYAGIVYHIYHKENPRDQLKENDLLQHKSIQEKIIRTEKGISQYL